MAIKLNAGKVKRGDLYFVDPFEIIVKDELRGRKFPPTPDQIVEMAMSIYDNKQRQPIECRRVAESKLQSTAGFTRTAAVRLIREGFVGTDGNHRHDPEFMIQVKIVDCNDETALMNNIIENAHRNETSDIDDAHNQNNLRENYGHSDVKIAELYQYKSSVKVGRLRKLLQLSDREQRLVHDGVMGTQAAIDLLSLDSEARKKIIDDLLADGNQKINGSVVADQVREHHLADADVDENENVDTRDDDDEPSEEPTGRVYKARSIRNIRKFFEAQKENDDPAIQRFAKDFLKYVAGKSTDKSMENALVRLLQAEETEFEDEDEQQQAA